MLRAGFARFTFALIAILVALASCSSSDSPSIFQDLDFQTPKGFDLTFDMNNVVEDAAFIDIDQITVAAIDKFLEKTPYDRPSFLQTYQSNGVRAADAMARAARTYRINPLVFLVFAQTTQGLVGERNYPFPPERVEYVFGCGCLRSGSCLPELAGFDRQVDCLGRALRVELEAIAKDNRTASGWGPGITTLTLDGQKVTPANDATSVIYDRRPAVATGKAGGSWLFWNVWNQYALNLDYSGSFGGGTGGSWIGDVCVSDKTCGYDNAICATNYPDGLCTRECDGTCPSQTDKPQAFCAAFPEGGFCFQVCNPGAPACRRGYQCVRIERYKGAGATDSMPVCYPTETP